MGSVNSNYYSLNFISYIFGKRFGRVEYTDPIANENKKYTNILLWVNKKLKTTSYQQSVT